MKLSHFLLIAGCHILVSGIYTQSFSLTNYSLKYHTVYSFSANDVKFIQAWLSERENRNKTYLYSLDRERIMPNFRVNADIVLTHYAAIHP